MSIDAFTPPQSELLSPELEKTPEYFYIVSPIKFVALYICTLGLYSIFWHFMNWRRFKRASGQDMWPVARAIFSIFFTHSLFYEVSERIRINKIKYHWHDSLWATVFVVFAIASRTLDNVAARSETYAMADYLSFACLPIVMLALLRAQIAINISAGDPKGSTNANFTIFNILWIVSGLILWGLIALGLLNTYGVIDLSGA